MATVSQNWTAALSITSESFYASAGSNTVFNADGVLAALDVSATLRWFATPTIAIIARVALAGIRSNFIYTFGVNIADVKTRLAFIDIHASFSTLRVDLLVARIANAFKGIFFDNACAVRPTSCSTLLAWINICKQQKLEAEMLMWGCFCYHQAVRFYCSSRIG